MKSNIKNKKSLGGVPLGVISEKGTVFMFIRVDKKTTSLIELLSSPNGIDFYNTEEKISVKTDAGKKEVIKNCSRFSISRTPNGFVMTYVRNAAKKEEPKIIFARSKDLIDWKIMSEMKVDEFHHTSVTYDKEKDKFNLYRDGLFIKHQSSTTLSVWRDRPTLLFTSRNKMFDSGVLSIIGSIIIKEGVLMLYDASIESGTKTLLQVGAAIINKDDPKRINWRSIEPVWQGAVDSKKHTHPIAPLGFVSHGKNYIIYWVTNEGDLIVVKILELFKEIQDARYHPKILERHEGNPIIRPRLVHDWEGEGTFNPAVVEDDEGTIHLLYRAVGRDGISRVGYAQSKDGTTFTRRSDRPVFQAPLGLGLPDKETFTGPMVYSHLLYTSGGGWGGSEDPRLVKIGSTVYMTYVAFEGWGSMRIALTSISLEDFKAGRWHWKKPKLISPPNVMAKNWLIFPEKINGKYAVFHGLFPKILIEYIDDIDTFEGYIYSQRPQGAPQPGRKKAWDGLLRGAGPPPLKTELGWLLLYHALDKNDQDKYKLGAMILDLNDPTKILYRSAHPILAPDFHYENDGKPGVVYASGALIIDGDLHVYYGGADKVCCVAKTPLKKLLKYLQTGDAKTYYLTNIKK